MNSLNELNRLKKTISELRAVNRILMYEASNLRISKENAREALSECRRENNKLRESFGVVRNSREVWKEKYKSLKTAVSAALTKKEELS